MVRWSKDSLRIPVKGRDRNVSVSAYQPFALSRVRWSEMQYFRRKPRPNNGSTTHRRHLRGEPPLHAASLGSPIFVESWNGGSPLNWVEFMGRWETRRSDQSTRTQDD